MAYPIPTSDHNGQLTGDTLTGVLLNYQWRKIIADAIDLHLQKIASTIADETDRQEFEQRCGNLLIDFYNEDILDFTPVGTISAFVGSVAPDKWLLCDGSPYDGGDYPALYAVLPSVFKDAFGNFSTPNLEDRFPLGAGVYTTVGGLGGENAHILTIAEMPAHTHTIPAADNTGVQARAARGGGTNLGTITSSSQGSGTAHNNMPPYIGVNWIIKALP